jgi:phosphoesterase RecJ-like protein
MDLTLKLQLAYQKISQAKNILIIGHTSPDADALASVGAMVEISKSFGSEIYAYTDNKQSGAYEFIENEASVSSEEPSDLKIFDVILVLDCGSISRTGLELRLHNLISAAAKGLIKSRPYIIEFDHHEPQGTYADLEIKDAGKASTTELIYQFLKANGITITKSLADCILIGLMTDTGHFLHANSSQEALAVASEMLMRGAALPMIIDKTVHNQSFSSLKVWGQALENMKFNPDTGFVSSALSELELSTLLTPEEKDTQGDLFGGIASFLSCLSGVRVALFLREENGKVKGSLRTNLDDVDVAQLASNWGGGGHKKAAGFSVEGKLQATDTGWRVVKI